jgi:hypothetical protein
MSDMEPWHHQCVTPYCRTVCLLHGSLLCACKPSAWRMVFGKSVAELEAQADALRPRLPAPGGARGVCSAAMARQIEAADMQASQHRARQPSLVVAELKRGSAHAVAVGLTTCHMRLQGRSSRRNWRQSAAGRRM